VPEGPEPIEHILNAVAPGERDFTAPMPSTSVCVVVDFRLVEDLLENLSFAIDSGLSYATLPGIGVELSFVGHEGGGV